MTIATDIRERFVRFLGEEVEVRPVGDRVAVLTPAEYPDGDGIVVWVSERESGRYEITDIGEADARLVPDGPGARAIGPLAVAICRRFGVDFEGGAVVGRVEADLVAETCWRVAQAAAAIAEAATYHRKQQPKEASFVDAVASELRGQQLTVQTEVELEGASRHHYTASVFLPATELVIEPISGEQAWNKASAIYVQFGDLRSANGYKTMTVLDDLEGDIAKDVEGLLLQVGTVSRWSDRTTWLKTISTGRLI